MADYTDEDIYGGAGAFDQAMRSQQAISGTANRMRPAVAIGVLAAAMRSGLPASKLEWVIDNSFASSASLLKRVLAMYEGDDWDIHLWHRLPTGKYKLCTDLCLPGQGNWRYDPTTRALDDWAAPAC